MIIRDLIVKLQAYVDLDEKICALLWHREDIECEAETKDETLTDIEVGEVLERMEHNHDATIGVNWDVISYHIDEVLEKRPKVGEQMEFDFGEETT